MNGLKEQVYSIPDLFDEEFKRIEESTHDIITTPEMYSVKKVFLVGSGDSYAAALAVRNTFEKMLQIPVVVADPFDLVCYEQMKWVGESPLDPLVIGISNSGMAERTTEAVSWMRAHNALTVGITSNPESPFGKCVERIIDISIPKSVPAPGCRSFFMILTALYMMALRMGTVRLKFNMEDRQKCFDEMKNGMSWLRDNLDDISSMTEEYASEFKDAKAAEAVGSGPEQGMAWYTHAKWYEACGLPCVYSNSENWFHTDYFLRHVETTPVVVFDPHGAEAETRTDEVLLRMDEMGRKYLAVIDTDKKIRGRAVKLYKMPFSFLAPYMEWIVSALLCAAWAEQNNEEYSRGFKGIWREGKNSYNTMNTKAVRSV